MRQGDIHFSNPFTNQVSNLWRKKIFCGNITLANSRQRVGKAIMIVILSIMILHRNFPPDSCMKSQIQVLLLCIDL
jgi:hypothetical protein